MQPSIHTGQGATAASAPPQSHPQLDDIEAESRGWHEFADLVRSLAPEERMLPGYFENPDWSIRDLTAHLGTWLAEAEVQFERMVGGTYEGHDVDVDALNAAMLEAMHDQQWHVVWTQANAARTRMRQDWFGLREMSDEVTWWVRKAASEHYGEHLPRLRAWVAELHASR
jgi:hypothetical protein